MNKHLILSMLPCIVLSFAASAQKYTPHEQWPFVYDDFQAAELAMPGGVTARMKAVNIGIPDGRIYFIENDTLKVSTEYARYAKIGEDNYVLANGRLMKVLAQSEHGAVLYDAEINREAMSRADVGYGVKSSVSSTERRDILEGSNGSALSLRMVQKPLSELKPLKNGGRPLELKEIKYLCIDGGYTVRAIKSEVRQVPWLDKKDLDAFWKEHKVKYSDNQSLAEVAEYIYSQQVSPK